jgi:hypothetical protein
MLSQIIRFASWQALRIIDPAWTDEARRKAKQLEEDAPYVDQLRSFFGERTAREICELYRGEQASAYALTEQLRLANEELAKPADERSIRFERSRSLAVMEAAKWRSRFDELEAFARPLAEAAHAWAMSDDRSKEEAQSIQGIFASFPTACAALGVPTPTVERNLISRAAELLRRRVEADRSTDRAATPTDPGSSQATG